MRIFVSSQRSQAESYRRAAKDRFGDRYEHYVAPFRGLIILQMMRTGMKKDLLEIAQELIGIMKGAGKWKPHLSAAIFAAALDVEERKMLDRIRRPSPPPEENGEEMPNA